MPSALDIKWGFSFLSRLPLFLHHNITPSQARQTIQERMSSREHNFLQVMKRLIFGYPNSPYLKLMQCAGIELGDVEALVRSDGVEGALSRLLKAGVYITVDEFKGRKNAVRGSQTIETGPSTLRNPNSKFHVPVRSGGSRSGSGTPVMIDLAYVRDCAAVTCTIYHLNGGDNWLKGVWAVPGAGPLYRLLVLSQFRRRPVKWFTQLDPDSMELHARYRYSGTALRWVSLACGAPLPAVEYAPLDNPVPIARWMQSSLAQGEVPLLITLPSSAVRVALAARNNGLNIAGAWFRISGEPITEARTAVINSAGARIVPRYGSIETGPIAYCCINRQGPDELHVMQDLHGLIQAGEQGEALGVPANSLFISSLRPTSPYVMLNTSLGDQGDFIPGDCGCPVGELWPKRIKNIRSYEKLTCAGMSFLDTDVIRVLEEVLPRQFGGSATDYQLVEKEDAEGVPGLQLLVRPELGPLDENQIARTFLQELRSDSQTANTMGMAWEKGGVLEVLRRTPYNTISGKIQHLHVAKPQGDKSPQGPLQPKQN